MRIDVTTASFATAARPRLLPSSTQKIVQPLDDVIPLSCGIRDYIERGQVFGLFSKNIDVELNVGAEPRYYHCATIAIDMPEGLEIKGDQAQALSVYKDIQSGLFYFGTGDGGIFEDAMDGKDMGLKVMEWSRLFAGDNKSMQTAFLNTFSSKPLPDPGYAMRTAKAAVDELASFWRKTFG